MEFHGCALEHSLNLDGRSHTCDNSGANMMHSRSSASKHMGIRPDYYYYYFKNIYFPYIDLYIVIETTFRKFYRGWKK